MKGKFIDLNGQKFERWEVIERVENDKFGHSQWLCQCNCFGKNSLKIVKGDSLIRGTSKSCGCLAREAIIKTKKERRKYNTYDLTGEYGIGYLPKEGEFYFDLEDYNLIKDYYWRKKERGYIYTKPEDKYIRMHRLVTDCPEDMEVDHINHNTMDNRKNNLRIVTKSQNSMNRAIHTNNTSGVKGICWDKSCEKWSVEIQRNHKKIKIGTFNDFNDAVEARLQAEYKYHIGYRYNPEAEEIINNNTII